MRDAAISKIYELAKKNRNIILISNDQGAESLDNFRSHLKDQFINGGISEQNIIGASAGLASQNKRVFVYSIASFITYRCFEQIKLDLCVMEKPVTILAVGAGLSYSADGPTHHAIEDFGILGTLSNLNIYSPSDNKNLIKILDLCMKSQFANYIRMDRSILPDLESHKYSVIDGFRTVFENKKSKVCVVSTGNMVHVANQLIKTYKNFTLIDLFSINCLNESKLVAKISKYKKIITLEEHVFSGGVGSILSKLITNNNLNIKLVTKTIPNKNNYIYGNREQLHKNFNIDSIDLYKEICE